MGARRGVESVTTEAAVNGGANGRTNGHGKPVELKPFVIDHPAPPRHVPLRNLPEAMHLVPDVSRNSLLTRLSRIGAQRIPADDTMPERYSFYDGTHFEFGPEGPVFVMQGLGYYDKPQRIDLREAAVRETLDHTTEKPTSKLEFVLPFDELLQGHAGVTVLTITPHGRELRRISANDYASLLNNDKVLVDVGRILHNQQNIRRNRVTRRHIR